MAIDDLFPKDDATRQTVAVMGDAIWAMLRGYALARGSFEVINSVEPNGWANGGYELVLRIRDRRTFDMERLERNKLLINAIVETCRSYNDEELAERQMLWWAERAKDLRASGAV